MTEETTVSTDYGTLYLAATPIGNLEDMTYRAVRLLSEVDLIAAEDTRHTRHLLTHFDIHTKLTSYHEHNKLEKGPELIAYMKEGHDLICVSDAGLPGICDPGSHLAKLAIDAGIRVTPGTPPRKPPIGPGPPRHAASGLQCRAFRAHLLRT